MDENKDFKECDCNSENHHHHDEYMHHHWIRFAFILVTIFLACYLAVYYILDQMRHSYYIPARMDSIDKILEEQDKLFNDSQTFPMHINAMMVVKNPVETYKDDEYDTYKVIVNLKQFNNNPKNITVDVDESRISVSGEAEKTTKNSDNVYSFSQSFVLPEKINVEKVTKEKVKDKYVITLPILDEDED